MNNTRHCGKLCTSTWDCADDEKCSELFGWEVWTCSPKRGFRCEPCTANKGYCPGGYCVSYGDNGSFCADACTVDSDCGEGFVCKATTTSWSGPAKVCMAASGDCLCSPRAVSLGLASDCSTAGAMCKGIRTCTTVGQPPLACAPLPGPATETCNGLDNDCNGKTDDGSDLCPPGDPCKQPGMCSSGSCCGGPTKVCPNGELCSNGKCP